MSVQGPSNGGGGAGNDDGGGGGDRKRRCAVFLPRSIGILKSKRTRRMEDESQPEPAARVVEETVTKAKRKKREKVLAPAPAPVQKMMVKESHPLENSLVVSLVMAQLDIKAVKTCRLVNKLWFEEGGKLLRKKTKVNFMSSSTNFRLVDKFLKNTSRLTEEEMSIYSEFQMARAEMHHYFYERCGPGMKSLSYNIYSNRNQQPQPLAMTGEELQTILHQHCTKLETLKMARFPFSGYPAYEIGKNLYNLKELTFNITISLEFAQGIFLEAVNLQKIEVNLFDRAKLTLFFQAFDFAKTNGRLSKLKELYFIDTTLTLENLKCILAHGQTLNLETLTIESLTFDHQLMNGLNTLNQLLKSLATTLQCFLLNSCSWAPAIQQNNLITEVLFDLPLLPKLKRIRSIGNRINFNPSSVLVNLPSLEDWLFQTKETCWNPQEWAVQESMKSLKMPHQLQDTDLLQRMIFSFTELRKIHLFEPTSEVLSMFFRLMADSKLTDLDFVFDNSVHYDAVMAGWNIEETQNLLSTQTNSMDDPVDPENGIHRLKNLRRLEMSYIKRTQYNRIPGRAYVSANSRQTLNHASFTNGIARLKKGKALTLRNFNIPDEYLKTIEKNKIFEDCEFINCVIERKAEENSGVRFCFKKCSTIGN